MQRVTWQEEEDAALAMHPPLPNVLNPSFPGEYLLCCFSASSFPIHFWILISLTFTPITLLLSKGHQCCQESQVQRLCFVLAFAWRVTRFTTPSFLNLSLLTNWHILSCCFSQCCTSCIPPERSCWGFLAGAKTCVSSWDLLHANSLFGLTHTSSTLQLGKIPSPCLNCCSKITFSIGLGQLC